MSNNGVPLKSLARSLKMKPFDTSYTTSYQSTIVTIAVSCTIFEISDGEEYRDLDI